MIAVCLKPRVLANHCGQFKSVQLGHRDVDRDDGEFPSQKLRERLFSGRRFDEILAELLQDDLVTEQLRRLIVDEEYIQNSPENAGATPLISC